MNPTMTKAEAAAGLAEILNAALEHVPPTTRNLFGRSAQPLLTLLAGEPIEVKPPGEGAAPPVPENGTKTAPPANGKKGR
ncbi:MAG: hypothetical protein RLZZ127_56 [Planctomycetota bacterium]|jgi:hypothetical protein